MAMNIAQQFGASLTGNIETACLVLHDYRLAGFSMSRGKIPSSPEVKQQAIHNLRLADTKQALSEGASFPEFQGSANRQLSVHFNPSQLTLNVSTPVKDTKDTDTDKSKTAAQTDPTLSLTTVLFFDDMRIYDAFMWEKFTAGLTTQGIANLANFVKEGKGKVWTVQTQVEGLIAALRNPYTRNVSFRWADFCFIGQLDTVQAKYTMFSPAGRPVRAAVSLRLKHELDPSMLYRWYEDLDKAFTLGGATMLTRTQQYFQSLLNLGL